MTVLVVLFALIAALVPGYLRWLVGEEPPPALDRADTRPAAWFQLASYRGGRITHLTPMRDGQHFEDEIGDCVCNPRSGVYPTTDGGSGLFFVHREITTGPGRRSR